MLRYLISTTLLTLGMISTYALAQVITIDSEFVTPSLFFAQYESELGLTTEDHMEVVRTFTDKYGWTRTKYQQFHHNLKVKGAVYTLHSHNDKLIKGSGIIAKNIHIKQARAIDISGRIRYLSDRYREDITSTILDTVVMPADYPEHGGRYVIAYAIEFQNANPASPVKDVVYIEANTGLTIYTESKILHQSTVAIAETKYYGQQEIVTQKEDGVYLLRDTTRGKGIITVNGQERDFSLSYNYQDFTNQSTNWSWNGEWQTEVNTDAHYCASRYYDWMLDLFGWEGVDGFGGELICVNNVVGKYYVNAYWNGTATHYGNGDCVNYDPLTTLDVVGHEFAHGFTEFSSGLIYRNQSGALNEGISDIIGKSLEYYFDFDNFDWYIGNKFRLREEAGVFRSMKDPHERFDPKYYAGQYWVTSTGDNGGVHSNSGVLNYWFYVLTVGESGINEAEYSYNVQSIGIENALDLLFGTQVGYLTENSHYFDAMYATIEVAEEYWGKFSYEYEQIIEAWLAVGLYNGIDNQDLSLEVVNEESFLCINEPPIVQYIIRNVGRQVYSSNEVMIEWSSSDIEEYTETIQLPSRFMPGDSIIISSELEIILQPNVTTSYDVRIVTDEAHLLNNEASGVLYWSDNLSEIDIAIDDFAWRYDDVCNQTSVEGLELTLTNHGCQIIPKTDSFYFSFETSLGIVEFKEPIWFDFNPSRMSTFTYWINDIDLSDVSKFHVKVDSESNLMNNTINTPQLNQQHTITNGYIDNMENNAIPKFFISGSIYASLDSIINYEGNQVLAIAGRSGFSAFINCPDQEDFYNSNYQKKDISFCTNTDDMTSPELRFKVLSKPRYIEDNIDVPYHTMIHVDIPGTDPYLINTTEDEVWEDHVIELPQGFNDILVITAFVLSGQGTFELPKLEDSDYLLFDDFRLVESFASSTDDINEYQSLTVSPNPASSIITLQQSDLYDQVAIFNVDGKLIINNSQDKKQNIDIGDLQNGVYVIQTFYRNQPSGISKFIKI